jgi:WD40 repeat protein
VTSKSIQLTASGTKPPVITAIAVDPRGELIAAAGDDHLIRILNAGSLTPIETLSGHRDLIQTITFDPSGGRLASAGNDGQLILWDRDARFVPINRISAMPPLRCVVFSPDGSEIAAVGFDADVYIMRWGESELRKLRCQGTDLRAVAYRDDGRHLAVAGRSGELTLFDLSNGSHRRHLVHEGRIHGIAFHYHTNRVVCVADDGYVSVFDTKDERVVHRVPVSTGKLFAVAVLNSQLIAVAGSDNVIRIVNTDDGTLLRRIEGHQGSVSSLDAAGGMLFSGSYDTTLRRWAIADIETGGQRIAEGEPRIDR